MLRSDLACRFTICSLDTGYDFDYMCSVVDELIADGQSEKDAIEEVISMAYELDLCISIFLWRCK